MCYSAMVRAGLKALRRFRAELDYDEVELVYKQRIQMANIRIPRAFDANFDHPENARERRLKELADEYRAKITTETERDLFKQKTRLIFREPARGYAWIKTPNEAFGGRSALEVTGAITSVDAPMRVGRHSH